MQRFVYGRLFGFKFTSAKFIGTYHGLITLSFELLGARPRIKTTRSDQPQTRKLDYFKASLTRARNHVIRDFGVIFLLYFITLEPEDACSKSCIALALHYMITCISSPSHNCCNMRYFISTQTKSVT